MAGLLAFVAAVALTYLAATGRARASCDAPRSLVPDFVLSLVPIAFAYLVAHYFSFFVIQGQFLIALASDPFGRGWDLFGTVDYAPNLALVSPNTIWYVQVGLAHRRARRRARDRPRPRGRAVREPGRRSTLPVPDARAHGAVHGRRAVAALAELIAHGGTAGAIVESSSSSWSTGVFVAVWVRERRARRSAATARGLRTRRAVGTRTRVEQQRRERRGAARARRRRGRRARCRRPRRRLRRGSSAFPSGRRRRLASATADDRERPERVPDDREHARRATARARPGPRGCPCPRARPRAARRARLRPRAPSRRAPPAAPAASARSSEPAPRSGGGEEPAAEVVDAERGAPLQPAAAPHASAPAASAYGAERGRPRERLGRAASSGSAGRARRRAAA